MNTLSRAGLVARCRRNYRVKGRNPVGKKSRGVGIETWRVSVICRKHLFLAISVVYEGNGRKVFMKPFNHPLWIVQLRSEFLEWCQRHMKISSTIAFERWISKGCDNVKKSSAYLMTRLVSIIEVGNHRLNAILTATFGNVQQSRCQCKRSKFVRCWQKCYFVFLPWNGKGSLSYYP